MILGKISKRILFALLLCFVALVGAAGAYVIMMNNQSSVKLSRTAVSDGLILEVDKTVYELGENVTITFTNNSTETVAFPDYGWGTIRDSEGSIVAGGAGPQAVLSVPAGDSLTAVWDQLDSRTISMVSPGIYTANVTVYTAGLSLVIADLSVTFEIVGRPFLCNAREQLNVLSTSWSST